MSEESVRSRSMRLKVVGPALAGVVWLGIHEGLILAMGERALRPCYILAGLSYLPALFLTIEQARRATKPLSRVWWLWAAALAGGMLELLAAAVDWRQTWLAVPTLFQIPAFSLGLLATSYSARRDVSRAVRRIDVGLAVGVCVMCDAAFLLPNSMFSDPGWLPFLTGIRGVLLLAALLACRAAKDVNEYRLMRLIAIFQGWDLLGSLVLNQVMATWMHQNGTTSWDWMMDIAPLGLMVAMLAEPAGFNEAGRTRYMAQSGLSLFYTVILVGMGLWTFSRHPWLGCGGLVLALAGYGLRSTLVHSRSLEMEDQLRSSIVHFRSLADTDALTGAGNRRLFDRAIEFEWGRQMPDEPIALLLLDLDYFKQINDGMGHLYGDECLRAVAEVLRQSVRGSDRVFRFGGDEFAVLLPGTQRDGALDVANRIVAGVRELRMDRGNKGKLTVTVGVGVCSRVPERKRSELIDEADKSLYQAKELGRDRVGSAGFRMMG